jgi:hypothetical protein
MIPDAIFRKNIERHRIFIPTQTPRFISYSGKLYAPAYFRDRIRSMNKGLIIRRIGKKGI